jgi:hypothetical protein
MLKAAFIADRIAHCADERLVYLAIHNHGGERSESKSWQYLVPAPDFRYYSQEREAKSDRLTFKERREWIKDFTIVTSFWTAITTAAFFGYVGYLRRFDPPRYGTVTGEAWSLVMALIRAPIRKCCPLQRVSLSKRKSRGSGPAWNMDWEDQKKAPRGFVQGPVTARIVESGPVRVALEIARESEGSKFVQTIHLSAGDAGNRVEFANEIDWRTKEAALKATCL